MTKVDKIVQDWENTYRTKGVVQDQVLPTVEHALQKILKMKCRRVLDLAVVQEGTHSIWQNII